MTTAPTKDPSAGSQSKPTSAVARVPSGVTRRILRRETHSSRSGATVVMLIVLILVVGYVGVEAVYAALGQPPLLFSPVDAVATLLSAATAQPALVIAASIAAAILGLVLVVIGLTPGRRGRHTIDDDRVAVVVDDQVIAASLARNARIAGGLAPGQVTAWVARSSARITITPASGSTADTDAVLRAANDELGRIAYRPPVTAEARVTPNGRLGA